MKISSYKRIEKIENSIAFQISNYFIHLSLFLFFQFFCFNLSKGKYPELEIQMKQWIHEKRSIGACIDGFMIKNKGIQVAHTLKLTDFKGSNGWLNNYLL
jgi:hypothetical protein